MKPYPCQILETDVGNFEIPTDEALKSWKTFLEPKELSFYEQLDYGYKLEIAISVNPFKTFQDLYLTYGEITLPTDPKTPPSEKDSKTNDNTIMINDHVKYQGKFYVVLGYAARRDSKNKHLIEIAWNDYVLSPESGYLAISEDEISEVLRS